MRWADEMGWDGGECGRGVDGAGWWCLRRGGAGVLRAGTARFYWYSQVSREIKRIKEDVR
jgi:hypothetical protein